jgi:glycine cleavage system H lipoate-binding protein
MIQKQAAPIEEPMKCIWMTAGVVDYKLCDLEFDCENCSFDRAFRALKNAGKDQGFILDETLFYHPLHCWLRVEDGGKVRIGLDDFGQKLIGRIHSIFLPQTGTKVDGDHSWKIQHDYGETVFSNVATGTVLDVNHKLEVLPSLIHSDPYGKGWVLLLEPENLAESLKQLYYGSNVKAWHMAEVHRLREALEASAGVTGISLPDGGELFGTFEGLINSKIIDMFLSARETDRIRAGASAKKS